MNRVSLLIAVSVVASGCTASDDSVESASQPALVSSTPAADSKLRETLDRVVNQIEKRGDNAVVGKASSAPTSLDAAQSHIATVAKVPITASRAHNNWYVFGTVTSVEESLKFHAGFAMRHGDTQIFEFGFW